jgi:hypothetical protein
MLLLLMFNINQVVCGYFWIAAKVDLGDNIMSLFKKKKKKQAKLIN